MILSHLNQSECYERKVQECFPCFFNICNPQNNADVEVLEVQLEC